MKVNNKIKIMLQFYNQTVTTENKNKNIKISWHICN